MIIHISSTPNSLLLFDEPETHLHPNMIFRLMKVLNKILETYDSYAIIATHSAIVIQQIPSKHVMVLKNEDEELSVSRLPFESL
ncbi:MAG: AAA family ATPase [Candidatus Peribacteria bacterium]|nr:MAG: AAA family ATPase [Candidatus Peribacteria bacterium]